jgi:hypothetical protein
MYQRMRVGSCRACGRNGDQILRHGLKLLALLQQESVKSFVPFK